MSKSAEKSLVPRVKRDWGMTEYIWKTRKGQVTLVEHDGNVSTICWAVGRAKRLVTLPISDNLWIPPYVLDCLQTYSVK